jgi:hypothetical protein
MPHRGLRAGPDLTDCERSQDAGGDHGCDQCETATTFHDGSSIARAFAYGLRHCRAGTILFHVYCLFMRL